MKKFLLIPILLIAGSISASACGSCAAHNKADAKEGAQKMLFQRTVPNLAAQKMLFQRTVPNLAAQNSLQQLQ
jgi:hypothetical protein